MDYENLKVKFLNPLFYINFLIKFFSCVCVKTSKTLSAKYYQEIKREYKKDLVRDIKIFLKKKKKKRDNMVVNDTKISQKMKNKILLSVEKKYYKIIKNALL